MAETFRRLTASEIEFVKEQTRLLAADLAFYARAPVRMHLFGGGAYAFTIDAGGSGTFVDIYMNPSVLFDIRNRDRAIAVWRGMGFHELAHHLWPARAQYEQAVKEGFKDLFNLLDDEQNERRGRSQDPAWGACFQTTVAWVFRKKSKGQKGYVARFNEFAYHFRRHLPGAVDPVVVEALALIPRNYKELAKDELLALARQVQATLSRGVEVPSVIPGAPHDHEPEKKPAAPPAAPPPVKPQPAEPEVAERSFWRSVFGSLWTYVLLAVFALGWVALFTHRGLNGWDKVFWVLLAATIASTGLTVLLMWLERRRWKLLFDGKTGDKLPGRWAVLKEAVKAGWPKVRDRLTRVAGRVGAVLEKYTPKPVARAAAWFRRRALAPSGRLAWWLLKKLGSAALSVLLGLRAFLGWLGRGMRWLAAKLWKSRIFRILMLSLPLALLLVMGTAVVAKTNWWALLIILLVLLLLFLLGWLFRKRIKAFVALPPPTGGDEDSDEQSRDDGEMLEFRVIHNVVAMEANQAELEALLPDVLPLAQQMRRYFEQTGIVAVDLDDQETGHELVDDLEKAALGEVGLCVDEKKVPKASVHIEVGIDCSGSMNSEKIRLAKRFGLLVEESIRGVRGISAHFWGFTDQAIFDCGTAGQYRVSGLQAGGGNNDSAMLWHMYRSAAASGMELKILLMVSDGAPTECTWSSLNNLVCRLEAAGYVPVQIAVDRIANPAFQRWFVDLVGQPMAAAVIEFGRMLLALVEQQR